MFFFFYKIHNNDQPRAHTLCFDRYNTENFIHDYQIYFNWKTQSNNTHTKNGRVCARARSQTNKLSTNIFDAKQDQTN